MSNRRRAKIRRHRDGPWVVVERHKADGTYDWFTYHATRRGAARAVDAYMDHGKIKGFRP